MTGPGGEPGAAPPTLVAAAARGLCPRCGAPTLFAGVLKLAERCRACGLNLAGFDVGDGPAAFLTLILGAVLVGLACWLQVAVAPPWWVHLLIWPALALAAVVASLRVAKAALLAAEFRAKGAPKG